jgi:hypothetical protein
LGLKNPAQLSDLENLLNGLTPDGGRGLVSDASDPKRMAGWRATLVASPLLNNVWAVAPREAQVRIERGFVQAVNRALRAWEDVVTGVGTLAPKPDSPKIVLAVFRTNAAWDFSPELQATAVLLNLGLQSQNKAQTFSPSQVMAFESGLRDFFERSLTVRLDEQISQLKSPASKRLNLDQIVKGLSHKAAMDANSRATWARRDDRGNRNGQENTLFAYWRQNALVNARVAKLGERTHLIGKQGQLFAKVIKELRNGRSVNEHVAPRVVDSPERQAHSTETDRKPLAAKKSVEHEYGHYH